jgi:hypothetical protein
MRGRGVRSEGVLGLGFVGERVEGHWSLGFSRWV